MKPKGATVDIYRDLLDALPFPLWWLLIPVVVVVVVAAVVGWARTPSTGRSLDAQRRRSSRWATRRDLSPLLVRRVDPASDSTKPNRRETDDDPVRDPRRLVLGQFGRWQILHTGLHRSVAVFAPTGKGKTPRLVVPWLLRHDGPAVCTSVKGDVHRITIEHRRSCGPVWVLDPAGQTGEPPARWSALQHVTDLESAMDMAYLMTRSSRREGPSTANDDFWASMSRQLLAPCLLAAATSGETMSTVVRWVQTQNMGAPEAILDDLGDQAALAAWSAFTKAEEKTRGNMLTSATSILEPWMHPAIARMGDVASKDGGPVLDIDALLDQSGTVYLVGTMDQQEMLSPIFELITGLIAATISKRGLASGLPISPPLLMLLDEASNICRIRDMGKWASAMAGQGMILVSIWQDEAQLRTAYGADKAREILANHSASLYLSGISDTDTLETISKRVGTAAFRQQSVSLDQRSGHGSTTLSTGEHEVAPSRWLQENIRTGQAVLFVQEFKPAMINVAGWWEQEPLRKLVPEKVAKSFDDLYAERSRRHRRILPGRLRPAGKA